jgi:hypothetical protein
MVSYHFNSSFFSQLRSKKMGFVAITFSGWNENHLTNIYVSLFSFALSRQSNGWTCRMILQAHRSREEKQSGIQGMFLPNSLQVYDFVHDLSDNIYNKCYEYAKLMFGPPENIIDEIDGVIQWPVVDPPATITVIDMSGNVDLSGNTDLSGNNP